MPQIMPSVDDTMAHEQRDIFFIRFGWPYHRNPGHPCQQRHFDWFTKHGLRWESAAPRGWLEGDSGVHAVFFDGPGDPQVALYAAEFEDETGKSLDSDKYQMVLLPYEWWLDGSWTDSGGDGQDGEGPP